MLVMQLNATYCDNQTKQINTLNMRQRRNANVLNTKTGDTQGYIKCK